MGDPSAILGRVQNSRSYSWMGSGLRRLALGPCKSTPSWVIAEAACSAEASRRQIRLSTVDYLREILPGDRPSLRLERRLRIELHEALELAVRSVDSVVAAFLAAGALVAVGSWFTIVGPFEALLLSLRRLILVSRRADVSRQLAVQRLKFACRAARSSPDAPPGEVVVSSAHVPRGPDLRQVIPVQLSITRRVACLT
jgi:hypothetical protein